MKKKHTFLLLTVVFFGSLLLCLRALYITEGVNYLPEFAGTSAVTFENSKENTEYIYLKPGETVNINTASPVQLKKLPGIGSALAQAIVADREENGSFECIEDIMRVKGLGKGKFEEIKGYIRVENYPKM